MPTSDIDECLSHPCQNGGTCSQQGVNKFTCACAPGYEGDICDTGKSWPDLKKNLNENPCNFSDLIQFLRK